MTELTGPLLIACAMLAIGGVVKIATPLATRRALHALGLPAQAGLVRALGTGEVALAIAAPLVGGVVLPALVGLAYLAFAAFVVVAIRDGNVGSCGCFGAASTAPSRLHVVVNVALGGIAFASIGTEPLLDVLADQRAFGAPLLGLSIVGTGLCYLVLTALPALFDPTAEPEAPGFALRPRDATAPASSPASRSPVGLTP